MRDSWLLIGGAGYIGSHLALKLKESGKRVVVLDNLSTGLGRRLSKEDAFYLSDSRDSDVIVDICEKHRIKTIVHLAAKRQARESVLNPIDYWTHNLSSVLGLAASLPRLDVENILFSSSCSVYGNAPVVGSHTELSPVSPYGRTKLVSEQILRDATCHYPIKLGILRYFNVIGADPSFPFWDETKGALLPALSEHILKNSDFVINGDDYATPDGTVVRDYIDVRDLVDAHILLEQYISRNNLDATVNVGSSNPVSVLEFAMEVKCQVAQNLRINFGPRVEGDPESIYSASDSIMSDIGWTPKYNWKQSVADHFKSKENLFT